MGKILEGIPLADQWKPQPEDIYFTICYNKYVFYNKTTVKEEMLNKLVFWLNADKGLRNLLTE